MGKFENYLTTLKEEDSGSVASCSGDIGEVPLGGGDKNDDDANKLLKRKKKNKYSLKESDSEFEYEIDDEDDEDFDEDDEDDLQDAADQIDYDVNGDGVISPSDIAYMVKNLSRKALIEVIDLIASYFENKFEEPDMVIPADGRLRVYEAIIKQVTDDKIIKKSSKLGYKLVDGNEVPMTDKDARERIAVALDKSKYRKSKQRKSKDAGVNDACDGDICTDC